MIFPINIPDDKVDRVVVGLCKKGNYKDQPEPKPSKQAFAKQELLDIVRRAFHVGNLIAIKATHRTEITSAVQQATTEAEDITI